ncbi:cytochrome c1 [Kangiella koreensis]|uniref:Cytochrome c1 n=1 Tax=Kangiella koreensis (strain DSM 16069 / JCM 12317 / KCTC 12182 / SW-125) TaxID=523791 RepID=C7R9J8_KANKD|nr:cytochrome c1 [Kangiella koreensis]ACV26089.1 cytochrome c1 [Kangiella koreensis DSM 16069]
MKKLITAILFLLPVSAFAAGGGNFYPNEPANIDLSDKTSLQNGAKLYVNYCLGCHSMEYVRYSRIAQDLELTEEQTVNNLILGDQRFGDTLDKSMNSEQAQKKYFGVDPLDLSLVARVRGEDWVYNYLRSFYVDSSRPFGVNNTVFPQVGMPHILADLQGLQAKSDALLSVEEQIAEAKAVLNDSEASDEAKAEAKEKQHRAEVEMAKLAAQGNMFVQIEEGQMTPEEYDESIRDLTAFMAYTANPVKLESKRMGVWVLMFLFVLLILAYFLKKEFWKDVH